MSERYYSFISYKHYDKEKNLFKEDEIWAFELARQLEQMQIPIAPNPSFPPIDDSCFINLNPKDETVSPIFRDGAIWGKKNDFTIAIKEALNSSKTLVIIISDNMIVDQDERLYKRENGLETEPPYCYDEIDYFLSLPEHSVDDIIPIYIEPKNVKSVNEILPLTLIRKLIGKNKNRTDISQEEKKLLNLKNYKPICIYDEVFEKNKDWETEKPNLIEWGAAKIAATIFNTHVQAFLSYRQQQEERRAAIEKAQIKKRKKIIWTSILTIIVTILISMLSWKRINAYRILDESKIALSDNNIPKAIDLSNKAAKTGGNIPEIREMQLKLFENDYTQPIQIIKRKHIIESPSSELWIIDEDNNSINLLKGLNSIEHVPFPNDYIQNGITFSADGKLIAFSGYDSIYVYNRNTASFVFSVPCNGAFGNLYSGDINFTSNGDYLIRHFPDSLLVHSINDGHTSTIKVISDKIIVLEKDLLIVRHDSDHLYVQTLFPQEGTINDLFVWNLLSDYNDLIWNSYSNTLITISKDTISYYSALNSHTMQVLSGQTSPVVISDKESDLFATIDTRNSNGYHIETISLWKNGRSIKQNNRFSDITGISFGKKDEVIIYSRESISVWNYIEDKIFHLDASKNSLSGLVDKPHLFFNDKYLFISNETPGIEDDFYTTYLYPDLSMIDAIDNKLYFCDSTLLGHSELLGLSRYYLRVTQAKNGLLAWERVFNTNGLSYGNSWILADNTIYSAETGDQLLTENFDRCKRYLILEEENRVFLFYDHYYKVFSLSEGKMLSHVSYPCEKDISVVETVNKGNGILFVGLRLFLPSDIGSMKGESWLMTINMNDGSLTNSIYINDFFFITDDEEGLMFYTPSGDIKRINEQLLTVDSINIGESVASKPQKSIKDIYYASSDNGNLYKFSFKRNWVKKINLPYPCETYNGMIYNNHYCLIQTNENNDNSRYLYDLDEKRIVLYVLPKETIERIVNDKAIISYSNSNPPMYLHYERPLMGGKELKRTIKNMYNH